MVEEVVESQPIVEELQRRIVPSADILRYIKAGRATFTLRSVQSGKRYTFKVNKWKKKEGWWFVALMTGNDNENAFELLGTIVNEKFSHSPRSRILPWSESVKAFSFTWQWLNVKPELTPNIEFWHSGRCGRCGKKLTVPESIALGLGPECASKGF